MEMINGLLTPTELQCLPEKNVVCVLDGMGLGMGMGINE